MRSKRHETLEAPVRTNADLHKLWEALMGTEGFDRVSLWLLFLHSDGYPAKVIMPIDDLPAEPDYHGIGNIALVAAGLAETEAVRSVPVLLSRPGPAMMTSRDRRWARALHEHGGPMLNHWPIHLAAQDRVQVFAPDDLIASAS